MKLYSMRVYSCVLRVILEPTDSSTETNVNRSLRTNESSRAADNATGLDETEIVTRAVTGDDFCFVQSSSTRLSTIFVCTRHGIETATRGGVDARDRIFRRGSRLAVSRSPDRKSDGWKLPRNVSIRRKRTICPIRVERGRSPGEE